MTNGVDRRFQTRPGFGSRRPARTAALAKRISWLVVGGAVVGLVSGALSVGVAIAVVGIGVVAPHLLRIAGVRLQPAARRLPARQALIEAEAATAFRKLFRRGNARPQVLRGIRSSGPDPAHAAAYPSIVYMNSPGEYAKSCNAIVWDGEALTVTDRRGREFAWRTVAGGVERNAFRRDAGSAPDLGDLLVAELAVSGSRSMPLDRLHVLDRWSRQLATVPVLGFSEEALAEVARCAGVAFTVYEIPPRVVTTPETMVGALFPRSVLYHRISGVAPEWRWLERAKGVLRLFKVFAEL